MPEVTWAPLLAPRRSAAIERVVADVAAALAKPPPPPRGDEDAIVGLFGREPGFAIFYQYLAGMTGAPRHGALARRHLETALAGVPASSHRPFFGAGFAGAAWAVEHLGASGRGRADPSREIDAALLDVVRRAPSLSPDLQNGLAGFGVYALERLPRPGARRLLEAVVDRLERTALRDRHGIAWRTDRAWIFLPDSPPGGAVFTGVQNGCAGPACVLAAAAHVGVARPEALALADEAMAGLFRMRRADGLFDTPDADQLTWSVGSLGVAAAIHAAARAAGLDHWARRALTLARRLADLPADRFTARDSSLGSGVAGTLLAFARLFAATGDERFAAAARRAATTLVGRHHLGRGLGGYVFHSPVWQCALLGREDYPTGWIGLPGLTNGIAGIGLALLAASTNVEPAWDRALLLSHRPG